MGILYSNGIGVEKNNTKAVLFFEKAAAIGNVDSIINLAILSFQGYDKTPRNETRAILLMMSIVQKSSRA